jgi:hypothetical protein
MAFPTELASFKCEDDFIQRFLIPLLKRLGFSVVNYHGTREHGRDLIVAEMDRFGHVRYHGVQAKYVESLGLGAMQSVIDDCQQAFAVTFDHPQTGAKEYLSTFYAVNGGSISDDARERYFGYLKPRHGDNAKLIDGKALVVLDRWASISRQQLIGETLVGLRAEIIMNRNRMNKFIPLFREVLRDPNSPMPYDRFRDEAASSYLVRPIAGGRVPYGVVGGYADQARSFNRVLDLCVGMSTVEYKRGAAQSILDLVSQFDAWATEIQGAIEGTLAELGPLTGL